jgi:hypothetical protein
MTEGYPGQDGWIRPHQQQQRRDGSAFVQVPAVETVHLLYGQGGGWASVF